MSTPLMQTHAVTRTFELGATFFRRGRTLHAVNGVDLAIERGDQATHQRRRLGHRRHAPDRHHVADADHVEEGERLGRLRQHVAAMRAPHAGHDAGTPHPQQDLLDIIGGKSFLGRDLATCDGPVTIPPGEIQ